ncbi:hypothetical protein LO762_12510 [Actinocorallia sp. API 0066]|uniref:hypothetical protein n=1 Tax=Actinocorallia sp. API 0066 TaxID=2896846 RepID=UPI001E2B4078|nr:hypothetical protein [Actinocorallia sp. API 0066]MCD0450008.1 hypothetical protein [Actinocorallia sp. API 0066]
MSLADACQAFGVHEGKGDPGGGHGVITPAYVDYCRRDVLATAGLMAATLAEFERHPVNLTAPYAYSPASIAKAYLDAMGIIPPLERCPDFPPQILGHAMSAFFGGRSECHIRNTPVPISLVDFTSMYPTVDALLGLWPHLTSCTITATDATADVAAWLDSLTLDDLFRPETWPQLVGIAQIKPSGDILPVKARYGTDRSWSNAVNPLYSPEPLWFTLADLAASKILTGHVPEIQAAFRFAPEGTADGLKPVNLRGVLPVDPADGDFFREVVQERQRLKTATRDHDAPCGCAGCRTHAFLKILANAGSYGIHVEMHRERASGRKLTPVRVYGAPTESWTTRVDRPEAPAERCFPPLAACITGAGRLLLAMLEKCVTDSGGVWALADTDSMAIVADEHGTLIPCPGGPHLTDDGRPAVRALTYSQVEQIRRRFDTLNPYDPDTVPELLKHELSAWCLAISAKRYACYQLRPDGTPRVLDLPDDEPGGMVKHSEHGLGHLLNPTDPDSPDRDWIRQLWELIIADVHGVKVTEPACLDRPALSRTTITRPAQLRAFNTDPGPYRDQIKPWGFMLTAHLSLNGRPASVAPDAPFLLVAPYNPDPSTWNTLDWRNRHAPDQGPYKLTTDPDAYDETNRPPDTARARTYREVLNAYRRHPERKAAAPDGTPSTQDTTGLLRRLPVRAPSLHHLGKETNDLHEVQAGLISDPDEVQADYTEPDAAWRSLALRLLSRIPADQLAQLITNDPTIKATVTDRTIYRIRAGAEPQPDLRHALTLTALRLALTDLPDIPTRTPEHPWPSVLGYWRDHHPEPTTPARTCPCGCETPLTGRQSYASDTCRKSVSRRNKTTT